MKSNLEDKLVFARCVAIICAIGFVWSVWNFSKMANEATRLQGEVTKLRIELLGR